MQETTSRNQPERFDPGSMRGQLIEAEHLARYTWAAALADGARVLDAGCGLGYGAAVLHEAGAESVVGVDISLAAIELAASAVPSDVELRQGDLSALDLPDDTFDLVVCFEVLEHIEDGAAVLDELRRVLRPEGVLVVSSPNRREYPPGNPFHVHEYTPEELRAALDQRFAFVRLARQQSWAASAIVDDEALEDASLRDLGMAVRKCAGIAPGSEMYTIAVASAVPLPDLAGAATLTLPIALRQWLETYDHQQQILEAQLAIHDQQVDALTQVGELHERLREAGRQYQEITELEQTTLAARRDQGDAERERDVLAEQLEEALEANAANEALLERAEQVRRSLMTSWSWRITAPLRRLKS